jgi:DNA-binding transcriptional MerR regulator
MTTETFIGITELTEEFGVTTRTLRFYEDRKLLSPFRRGRKRLYRPRDRIRLRLILRGKRLGLSLDEIAEIIDLYDETSGPQKQIDKLLERIEARRAALKRQRQDIDDALAELATVEKKARDHLASLKVSAS